MWASELILFNLDLTSRIPRDSGRQLAELQRTTKAEGSREN